MNEYLKKYEDIFLQLKKSFKWEMADSKLFMNASSMYVLKEKDFSLARYRDLTEHIKKEAALFSPLRSTPRLTMGAVLDTNYEEPKERLKDVELIYKELRNQKFKKGAATYTTALVLLSSGDRTVPFHEQTSKTMEVHRAMKKEHPFITSEHDYPLASLLAQRKENTEELMNRIEYFYKEATGIGLHKGNDLQFLSHILSLDEEHEKEELVERLKEAAAEWKKSGLKLKQLHYPALALLALTSLEKVTFEKIKRTADDLNRKKPFRWHKDWNSLTAANLVMVTLFDQQKAVDVHLFATMETVMEAQNAAMIATIAGGAAVSSSGS
ncbi:DUF4003 family protein [Alkalicoccus saliphilus]|uniref:DUF4003 domain-containing protein n=1 Tax=Alkalicoccus saliphilus TaxID=200989 RepID=A0A2T4U9Q5_9BACI|nr:DUF4003 family protein [Alkalicoccus saliphilus]PTL40117.1 hypothetical protein C6Y45_01685 [Alkalicoccus saliphilus]